LFQLISLLFTTFSLGNSKCMLHFTQSWYTLAKRTEAPTHLQEVSLIQGWGSLYCTISILTSIGEEKLFPWNYPLIYCEDQNLLLELTLHYGNHKLCLNINMMLI
jgi:hypothetical protein